MDGGGATPRRIDPVSVLSIVAVVVALPAVWAIGYQDHPTKSPGLAVAVGVALVVAAGALTVADDGRRSGWLALATWLAAIVALLLAIAWAVLGP